MPDRDPLLHGPDFPFRVAIVGPLLGWAAGATLATLAAAALRLIGGGTTLTAALALGLVSAGFLAGGLAVAWRAERIEPDDVGLGRFPLAATAAWTVLVCAPSLALAWAGLRGESLAIALPPPEILTDASTTLAFGEPLPAVPFDLGVAAAAAALVVLPAIAAEVVIRGIVLPSVARSMGIAPGVAVAALLTPAPFGMLSGGEVSGPVAAAALLAGVGLSLAYLRTGSVHPGVATLALGLGLAFGGSLGWSPAGAAGLALACTALALALSAWLAAVWQARAASRL